MNRVLTAAVLCCAAVSSTFAAETPTFMARRGSAMFADDFESRSELGAGWRSAIAKVFVKDGVLVGEELPEKKHAAVVKRPLAYKDIVADFDFRFDGGKGVNFVMDDPTYKGAHAGHIARVTFNVWGINLGDSKTGVMANENYDNKDKPEFKEKLAAVRKATEAPAKVKLEQGRWYHATVEIVGEEGVVSLNGKPVAYLKSPGLAHETKNTLGFSISGQTASVDNLRIHAAEADKQWPARKAKVQAEIARNAAAAPATPVKRGKARR